MNIRLKKPVVISAYVLSITSALSFGTSDFNYAQAQQKEYFSCVDYQGIPTIIVNLQGGGEKPFIKLESLYFASSGYTPLIRCNQIKHRLNTFFNISHENYLKGGTMNGLPVIFVEDKNTKQKSLLYTLRPGYNPNDAIENLVNLLDPDNTKQTIRPQYEGRCHYSLSLNSLIKGKTQSKCI